MTPNSTTRIKNLAKTVNEFLLAKGSINSLELALEDCLEFWPEILDEDPIDPPLKPRWTEQASKECGLN